MNEAAATRRPSARCMAGARATGMRTIACHAAPHDTAFEAGAAAARRIRSGPECDKKAGAARRRLGAASAAACFAGTQGVPALTDAVISKQFVTQSPGHRG
jgi:hypothetical protein